MIDTILPKLVFLFTFPGILSAACQNPHLGIKQSATAHMQHMDILRRMEGSGASGFGSLYSCRMPATMKGCTRAIPMNAMRGSLYPPLVERASL